MLHIIIAIPTSAVLKPAQAGLVQSYLTYPTFSNIFLVYKIGWVLLALLIQLVAVER